MKLLTQVVYGQNPSLNTILHEKKINDVIKEVPPDVIFGLYE